MVFFCYYSNEYTKSTSLLLQTPNYAIKTKSSELKSVLGIYLQQMSSFFVSFGMNRTLCVVNKKRCSFFRQFFLSVNSFIAMSWVMTQSIYSWFICSRTIFGEKKIKTTEQIIKNWNHYKELNLLEVTILFLNLITVLFKLNDISSCPKYSCYSTVCCNK